MGGSVAGKGGECSLKCQLACMGDMSAQGCWHVASSHSMTPYEYTSLFSLKLWLRSTSGAHLRGIGLTFRVKVTAYHVA